MMLRAWAGTAVPMPMSPWASTKRELLGAPPSTVTGTVAAVRSSRENAFAPPEAIVAFELPVGRRKPRRGAGVLESQADDRLLEEERLGTERLVVGAGKADAALPIHDEVVGHHLVLASDGGQPRLVLLREEDPTGQDREVSGLRDKLLPDNC